MTNTLSKSGNNIKVKFLKRFITQLVPVMKNGNPTKKMKAVNVAEYECANATGYIYEGHEIFLLDADAEDRDMSFIKTYKANGERLTCMAQFGRYGKADHEVTIDFYKQSQELGIHSNGWNGATWKGHGAGVKKINW